jgi:non-ribosomal peptide synthase protein (TIGR01720 family)
MNIKQVKEELRSVPNNGLGYCALKYLSENENGVNELALGQILFSYFSVNSADTLVQNGDRGFEVTLGGSYMSERNRANRNRLFPLNIDCVIEKEELSVTWTYSPLHFAQADVSELTLRFMSEVETIILHCASIPSTQHTPSDFPLARIKQVQLLDDVMSEIQSHNKQNSVEVVIEDLLVASPLQSGLLYSALKNPEADLYSVHYAEQIKGDVDKVCLFLCFFFSSYSVNANFLFTR